MGKKTPSTYHLRGEMESQGMITPVSRYNHPRWQSNTSLQTARKRNSAKRLSSDGEMRSHSVKWETDFWGIHWNLNHLDPSSQVTAWQMLNGDDVKDRKKIDSSLTCPPTLRRPEDLSGLPVMAFFQLRQVSDYIHRPQPSLRYQKELPSLTGFNTYPSNPVFEIPLLSCVGSPLLPLVSFCFRVLLVSASYPHFDSQSFLSSLAWRVTAQ